MFIHVVKAGETLSSIAKRYGGTPDHIRAANELPDGTLAPGMSLVIPAGLPTSLKAHPLEEGDSLERIAKKFQVPPHVIQGANPAFDEGELLAGQTLWVPHPHRNPQTLDVNAFMVPTGTGADEEILEDVADCLTYVSVFSYRISEEGTLSNLQDEQVILKSKEIRVAPVVTITNFDGKQFNADLAKTLLRNQAVRKTAVSNILKLVKDKGYHGVNIDFEHMYAEDREHFNSFIRELKEACQQDAVSVAVTLGPKMSDEPSNPWMGAYDYRTLGKVADQVTLLTFEWGWAGGPPMAVAPLNKVRRVLEYARTVIPVQKLYMGMALYGYNWPIPFSEGNRAAGISPKAAIDLAIRSNSHIHFPNDAASPMFSYKGPRGEIRQVWFEDARSVLAKFHLVQELGLRGISYWMLGHPFPQNWLLLSNVFRINKI